MSKNKWFMLFVSQLSILGLISALLRADVFANRGEIYQFLTVSCYTIMVIALGWWMSILFFDEGQITGRQRGLMICILPGTLLFFSQARTILVTKQGGSAGLLLLRTVGRLFVVISLVFIKGTITTKQ